MAFSATQCATEGFRIARRNPGALFIWGLYYLLSLAVFVGVIFLFAGPTFMEMIRNPAAASGEDPATAMKFIGGMFLGYFVGVILMIFMLSVLLGAVFRSVLKPEERGMAYLRIGSRELKLGVTSLVVGLLIMIAYFVSAIPIGLISVMSSAGGRAGGPNLAVLLIYVPLLLVFTGFSLSYPASWAKDGVRVFEGWRLAQGNYWKLVGMYLLVILICIAMFFVFAIVAVALLAAGGGMAMLGGSSAGMMNAMGPGLIIVFILLTILYMLVGVMTAVLFYGAQAKSYEQIVGHGTDVAQVF